MADLETLAREWLARYEDDKFDLTEVAVVALLRSRDERALRIVEEVQAEVGEFEGDTCDEIKRRLEEVAGE